ncbi:Terpenoid synthase [Penicillium subrubescens]|nr:Terpenoid synthase [Penicillium subrubescens]KAJ5904908.1 Terpenoid synthase [Penicillium subrubescens]
MTSLAYPEVLPERMELTAYTTELGFVHDDYTELEDIASSAPVHERLDYAVDPTRTETRDGSRKSLVMKKIYSAVILECLDIDLQSGLDMMKSYSDQWLKVVDAHPMPQFTTLDEYLEHRIKDSGTLVAFWQVAFGAGIRLSEGDYNMMEPLFKATARPTLLTNDFYSWRKESSQPRVRVTNAVLFYMKSGIAEHDAVVQLKQDILKKESDFLKMRDSFCRAHPNLPSHLKLMVNILAPLIGGYHYWCCLCPRYNCLQNPSAYAKANNTSLNGGCDNSYTLTHSSTLHIAERLRSSKTNSGNLSGFATSKLGQTALEGPIRYIQSLDSKNVRLQLIDAFNLWLGLPCLALNTIKEIVNDLHNSSLILDDIQDGSLLRRGSTATHIIFGNAQSINSATYMFVRVAGQVHALSNPALMTVLLEELERLFLGQSWELKWRSTMQCPTEEEYLAMVDHKTGAMFHMLLRLMLTLAQDDGCLSQSTEFTVLAQLLGRWYQVRDDYLNLQEAGYAKKKGFCEDLDEGKFSYPIVRCCADPVRKDIVIGLLDRRDTPEVPNLPLENKLQILDLIEKAGAIHETWRLIYQLQDKVQEEIGRLEAVLGEANPILRVLIKVLGNIPNPCKQL